MDYKKLAQAEFDYTVACRRRIHENPELSGKEVDTMAFITGELTGFGLEPIHIPDGGIVAVLEGALPGKTLLMRADIDALPMEESPENLKGPKAVVSKRPGAAHTCGHDAHTAMLLTVAKILTANRDQVKGRIIFCFEQGEEILKGHAGRIADYCVNNGLGYDACWGVHLNDIQPVGNVDIVTGPKLAGVHIFKYRIVGYGGHGSRPDVYNNPVDCFVAIYNAYANLRMRHVAPAATLSTSIGLVETDSKKENIIPGALTFGGTVRFYRDEETIVPFLKQFDRMIEEMGNLYECKIEAVDINGPHPSVENDADLADLAREAIRPVVGDELMQQVPPTMGSESFASYAKYAPGLFVFLGVGNPEMGTGAGGHNARYDVDERGFVNGVAASLAFAGAYLEK